jgi:AhpD family alkylhydroperoxidase
MTTAVAPSTSPAMEAERAFDRHLQGMREAIMDQRINYGKVAPEGIRALGGLETYLRGTGLEPGLLNLIKTRASQLNGCAYCIDMHTKDARATGETEQRLYALPAWRGTPFYTDREQAALAWTEAVTLISQGPVPDALYDKARRHFSEKELVDLTLALVAINGWNRLAIPFRTVPGTYQPKTPAAAAPEPRKGATA